MQIRVFVAPSEELRLESENRVQRFARLDWVLIESYAGKGNAHGTFCGTLNHLATLRIQARRWQARTSVLSLSNFEMNTVRHPASARQPLDTLESFSYGQEFEAPMHDSTTSDVACLR